MAGIAGGGAFLSNLSAGFPKGTIGSLVSGGFIPLLNIVVGIKVGAGLASLFFSMIKDLDAGETDEESRNGEDNAQKTVNEPKPKAPAL
jgi:multicomponent Na+:H+ antiporter subunit B